MIDIPGIVIISGWRDEGRQGIQIIPHQWELIVSIAGGTCRNIVLGVEPHEAVGHGRRAAESPIAGIILPPVILFLIDVRHSGGSIILVVRLPVPARSFREMHFGGAVGGGSTGISQIVDNQVGDASRATSGVPVDVPGAG